MGPGTWMRQCNKREIAYMCEIQNTSILLVFSEKQLEIRTLLGPDPSMALTL